MNADRFEGRVAEWLGEGPESAPPGLEAASLAYAADHPRTWQAGAARWLGRYGRVLAIAAALLLLGLAFAALPGARPTTPPAPTSVRGTESCSANVPGMEVSTTESGQARLVGSIEVCAVVASDARVAGELTRSLTADLFDPDASAPLGGSNHYGSAVLRGPDGAWAGPFVGTYLTRTPPWIDGQLAWFGLGSGAYRGLAYRATVTVDAEGRSTTEGVVEPVAVDAATALTWCVISSPDPAVAFTDPAHVDVQRTCTVTADDPRLAGTASEHRVVDTAADGGTSVRASIRLTAADGGWHGDLAGTGSWSVPGLVSGLLTGDGAFAGRTLVVRIASEDGMHGSLLAEARTP